MIRTITITGADEATNPTEMVELTKKYPAVEWGILVSRSSTGVHPRFPDHQVIIDMLAEVQDACPDVKFSLHLCGAYVREILMGDMDFIVEDLVSLWTFFDRVQINTHGEPHMYDAVKMVELMKLYPEKEFIFQVDDANTQVLTEAAAQGVKCSGLFDMSHGAGILPKEWPEPFKYVKCGYAGGISPANISSVMSKIQGLIGSTDTWIDMETHVRTKEPALTGDYLDLNKVGACLYAHSEYLKSLGAG